MPSYRARKRVPADVIKLMESEAAKHPGKYTELTFTTELRGWWRYDRATKKYSVRLINGRIW